NVHAVRGEDGELLYLEGTVEDVSDRWWGEQRRRLQYAAAQVFGDATTVEEARPHILETICEGLEWDIGIAWEVQPDGVLRAAELWHAPEASAEALQRALPRLVCRRGQKLAGEVWQSRESMWIPDVAEE